MARALLLSRRMRWSPLLLVLASCVGPSEIAMLGPPGRARSCSSPPETYETVPSGYRPIAIDVVPCPVRRDECLQQMQADACRLGASAIVGLHEEERWRAGTCLVGTLAEWGHPRSETPPPSPDD